MSQSEKALALRCQAQELKAAEDRTKTSKLRAVRRELAKIADNLVLLMGLYILGLVTGVFLL